MTRERAIRVWMVVAAVAAAVLGSRPAAGGGEGAAAAASDGYCEAGDALCGDRDANRFTFPHTDPSVDWNKRGIKEAKAGRLKQAAEYFRAGVVREGHRGDIWANLCLSLSNHATMTMEHSPSSAARTEAKANFREALAACDVAVILNNTPAKGTRDHTLGIFQKYFADECESSLDCKSYKKEARALAMHLSGDVIGAPNVICKSAEKVAVSMSQGERQLGVLFAETTLKMLTIFRVCGVVALEDVFNADLVGEIAAAQDADFDAFYARHVKRIKEDALLEDTGFASRSTDRFEVKLPLQQPYTNPAFTANRFILSFMRVALATNRIELDTFSTVTSLAGAPHQHWHADVDGLWPRLNIGIEKHLPAQGVVCVVPLVDMTPENGPTEFIAGSQVMMGHEYWTTKADGQVPKIQIPASRGSVVMFDLRTWHRGTPNKSSAKRAITYMSYVADWFVDRVNFKDHHSRHFDELPSDSLRKLFMRVDTRSYIAALEKVIEESQLADLSSLRSSARGYKQVDLHT